MSICPFLGLLQISEQRLPWGAGGPSLAMWLHQGTMCWPARWPLWHEEHLWELAAKPGSLLTHLAGRWEHVLLPKEEKLLISEIWQKEESLPAMQRGWEGGKKGDGNHSSAPMHLQRGLRNGSTFRWYQNGKKSDVADCFECHCPHLLWSCPRLPLSPWFASLRFLPNKNQKTLKISNKSPSNSFSHSFHFTVHLPFWL